MKNVHLNVLYVFFSFTFPSIKWITQEALFREWVISIRPPNPAIQYENSETTWCITILLRFQIFVSFQNLFPYFIQVDEIVYFNWAARMSTNELIFGMRAKRISWSISSMRAISQQKPSSGIFFLTGQHKSMPLW